MSENDHVRAIKVYAAEIRDGRYTADMLKQTEVALRVDHITRRADALADQLAEAAEDAQSAIDVPGWCEQVTMQRQADGTWFVSMMGDAHGTGRPSCGASFAPTIREATDRAADIAEGWVRFSLQPTDLPAPDDVGESA